MKTKYRCILAALLTVALAACGPDDDAGKCTAQYDTTEARAGASGLLLAPSRGSHLTFEEIEAVYEEVEQCTGIVAHGPNVAFNSFDHFGLGGYLGVYMRVTRDAWVNTDEQFGIASDCKLHKAVLRHEFVHHLLHEAGQHGDENRFHGSPLFESCGKIVVLNGKTQT